MELQTDSGQLIDLNTRPKIIQKDTRSALKVQSMEEATGAMYSHEGCVYFVNSYDV